MITDQQYYREKEIQTKAFWLGVKSTLTSIILGGLLLWALLSV